MPGANETADEALPFGTPPRPTPGLLLVWSAHLPRSSPYPFHATPLTLGRDEHSAVDLSPDDLVSRRHASVFHAGPDFVVTDERSRNGTYLDGVRVTGEVRTARRSVLRVGRSVFLLERDLNRLDERTDLRVGDSVIGPAMRALREEIRDAAHRGRSLLVHGETGSGKERLAKLFHESGPRARAPFLALNCAQLERERAEADLFGATRGAYTGADRTRAGLFERADGGVLFLDEVGELALDVQAKLLRVLEERLVHPLGGEPKRVDVAICCATHRDLRALVREGRFREDLLMRLVQREVHVPPLRARPEEIPYLVDLFRARVAGAPLASSRFVEVCLLRDWPGNLRDLEIFVERAASAAARRGDALVEPDAEAAGVVEPVMTPSGAPPAVTRSAREMRDEGVVAAVAANQGNVKRAAAQLGVSVSSVYAALERERERGE